MKIAIIIESLSKRKGGPARSVPILARELSCLGMDVFLFFLKSNDMNTHLLEDSKVVVKALEQLPTTDDFVDLYKNNGIQIVHTQGVWDLFFHRSVLAARRLNLPYLISPRGTLEPWAFQHHGWKKKLAMYLYAGKDLKKAKALVATATSEGENFRHLGIKTPYALIPNGLNLNEYPCRSEYEKSVIHKQILFLSRIHPKKGIELLIQAWNRLKDLFPEWQVKIVGNCESNDYRNKLDNLISQYGLNNSVSILPPVFGKEKYKLYIESSLFVLPTYSENFGMVIAEAMACGVPVITTKGAPWQCLEDEQMGWWIEPNTVSLTKTLEIALTQSSEKLFSMGQACSQYVRKHYDSRVITSKFLRVYDWISLQKEQPDFVVQVEC